MTTARTQPARPDALPRSRARVGGWSEEGQAATRRRCHSAELYDPTTGRFAPGGGPARRTQGMPMWRAEPAPLGTHPCHAPARRPGIRGWRRRDGERRRRNQGGCIQPTTGHWDQLDIGCDAARSVQARLADGRLLIVCVEGHGGRSEQSIILRAHLFDPATDTFRRPRGPRCGEDCDIAVRRPDPADGLPADARRRIGRLVRRPPSHLRCPSVPGSTSDAGRVLFLGDQAIPDEPPGQPALIFDAATGSFAVQQQPGIHDRRCRGAPPGRADPHGRLPARGTAPRPGTVAVSLVCRSGAEPQPSA